MKKQKLGVKRLGEPLENVYMVSLPDHESIADFLEKVPGAVPVERFIGKELFYFECNLTFDQRMMLKAKPRSNFRKEIRFSRVLILTIKGKEALSLDEGLEIVSVSPLIDAMHLIELIAVSPKTLREGKFKPTNVPMVHVYIQFRREEDAKARVNSLDAMPWGEWYVHSPQCDEHQVFYPDAGYDIDDYIWINNVVMKVFPFPILAPKTKKVRKSRGPPRLVDEDGNVDDDVENVSSSSSASPVPEVRQTVVKQIPPSPYLQNVTRIYNPPLPPTHCPAVNVVPTSPELLFALRHQQMLQTQMAPQPTVFFTTMPYQPVYIMNGGYATGVPVPGM
eukprot:TRINITY_DN5012_c0_g6_i1.p1 TRINITY_DN5012_c0_g6~~TRINITY_DN5012_c0_g6_i1.p1  ORF type:complete len:335 (+),score=87.14 TRINITY_DN5012_c0_g6_i1:64-1068(+)